MPRAVKLPSRTNNVSCNPAALRCQPHFLRQASLVCVKTMAAASPASGMAVSLQAVDIDNDTDPLCTVVRVSSASISPDFDLLSAMSAVFRDLGIDVAKAGMESEDGAVCNTFYVRVLGSGKLDAQNAELVRVAMIEVVSQRLAREASLAARPMFENVTPKNNKVLDTLMGMLSLRVLYVARPRMQRWDRI